MKKNLNVIMLAFAVILMFVSCSEPSPLYGTWADNKGNTIILQADGTYSSKMINTLGETIRSEGAYNVIGNALTFTTSEGMVLVTEWDIRISMLYLSWVDSENETLFLTLYKIAN